MTWSIVARDPATGDLGVAVASRFFAVGALVPHIRGGSGAVATQAFVNPLWGVEGARRLAAGEAAAAVIADFVARDAGQAPAPVPHDRRRGPVGGAYRRRMHRLVRASHRRGRFGRRQHAGRAGGGRGYAGHLPGRAAICPSPSGC